MASKKIPISFWKINKKKEKAFLLLFQLFNLNNFINKNKKIKKVKKGY